MSTNNQGNENRKKKKRRGRRGDNRNRNFVPTQFETPPCGICGETIKDITAAMTLESQEKPCHFDCILEHLAKQEELNEDEKIIYLGSDTFAVVQADQYAKRELNILRKIQFAKSEEREDWRKSMRNSLD